MYIIDTNIFVHSHRLNYPFGLFPTYWDKIAVFSQQKLISINTSIYQELSVEKDDISKDLLQKWIEDKFKGQIYKQDATIVNVWAEIINYIESSDYYKIEALNEWADENIADPWIIATDKAYNLTVVTYEQKSGGLNSVYPSKSAQIPDICEAFDVRCINLQEMLRELDFIL